MYKDSDIQERLIRDIYYVKADKTPDFKETSGIIIPTKYNRTDKAYCVQSGTIAMIPTYHTDLSPIEVELGDKVYFHHFVTTEKDYETEYEGVFKCRWDELICKVVDDKIIMIGDWCLLEQSDNTEEKTESGIFINVLEKKKDNFSVLAHCNNHILETGCKSGDKVLYAKDMDYEVDVEGKTYYRVSSKYILGRFEPCETL